jgi:hypothetical protein
VRVLLPRARCNCFHAYLKVANSEQTHSVYMGDVNFQDKVENNRGVVMGHAYSTATDGVRITGSSTNVWNGESSHFDRILTESTEHISRHKAE